jgi:cytoskeletal protein RodZ
MSFILDAIKKSESERRRAKQADTQSLQSELRHRGGSHGTAGKSLLLLCAIGILAAALWWFWPQLYAQLNHIRNSNSSSVETLQPPTTAKTDAVAENVTLEKKQSYSADDELPPRHLIKELWEMPADFQEVIPEFEFSFHFYSNTPAKRSTVINGRTMREGQMVSSKVKLRLITSSGVILYSRGSFFHINVVENW